MGGGDLNLKKSWHPSTLRNIERVWKAEQKHEAEKQKIEQLQKELAEERAREEIQAFAEDQGVVKKKGERLDWMYQGPAALVNREEYLLGRKIDKTFEILEQQESGRDAPNDEEKQPGAIFSQSSLSATVDLANKIREDPLFSIMKKEKEERKTLLNNPVKMKQLQQLLKKSLSSEKKKKKKKSKKKHKKSKHDSDSSDSSDSDYESSNKNVKRQKREHSLKQNSPEYGERMYKNSVKKEKDFHEGNTKYSHESYHSSKRNSDYSGETRDHHERWKSQFSRTSGYDHKSHDRRSHDSSEKLKYKQSHDYSSRESSNGWSHDGYRNGERKEEKKKLSDEDKEKLRQEMMNNAKWREEQRQRNVERYKKNVEREEKERKGNASEFIRPMLYKAASSGSVENRVKQKIFTIQRSKGDMDRNFARR